MLRDVSKPIPEPIEKLNGKIYGEHGETLNPTRRIGLMATLNKPVQTTTATLALVGLIPAFAAVLIMLAVNMLGWARDDGATKERLIQTGSDIQRMADSQKRIEEKLEKFDDRLRAQEVKDGEIRGVKTRQAAEGK